MGGHSASVLTPESVPPPSSEPAVPRALAKEGALEAGTQPLGCDWSRPPMGRGHCAAACLGGPVLGWEALFWGPVPWGVSLSLCFSHLHVASCNRNL